MNLIAALLISFQQKNAELIKKEIKLKAALIISFQQKRNSVNLKGNEFENTYTAPFPHKETAPN